MLTGFLKGAGVRSDHMYIAGLVSILGSMALWARSMRSSEADRAQRRAIFVGLWPPTFILLGNALKAEE